MNSWVKDFFGGEQNGFHVGELVSQREVAVTVVLM